MGVKPIVAILLILAGAIPAWIWQGHAYSARIDRMELDHAMALLASGDKARVEEVRRQVATDNASAQGAKEIEQVRTDDTDADDTVDRLRDELEAVRKRARSENSRLATRGATDRQAIMVLTELYQGADGRARELAAAFEDARARGMTCVAVYDSLKGI